MSESGTGDIYVHVRMKECCRTTLGKLDKRKKKAQFKGGTTGLRSLAETLGEQTIDDGAFVIATQRIQVGKRW